MHNTLHEFEETLSAARAFCDSAIDQGLITEKDAAAALDTKIKLEESGTLEPIASILLKRGSLTAEAAAELAGQMGSTRQLAGYEVLAKIGQGAMGAVFKARQVSMDRIVALKVLPPRFAQDKTFIKRFQREARASARLSHPHLIRGIDFGHSGPWWYFAMEYVPGGTVRDRVQRRGPLPEREALDIALAIARALDYAWTEARLVHRDIKPDNIILSEDGVPRLCDLGLAKTAAGDISGGVTSTTLAVGTPYYISPEQARGRPDVDVRSDIYSLGATLYYMLTGAPLFKGDAAPVIMSRHITDHAPPPCEASPGVSHRTCAVISRMLAKKCEDRYASPADLATDIEAVLADRDPQGAMGFTADSSVSCPDAAGRTGKEEEAGGGVEVIRAGRSRGWGPLVYTALGAAAVIAAILTALWFYRDNAAGRRAALEGRLAQAYSRIQASPEEWDNHMALLRALRSDAEGAEEGEIAAQVDRAIDSVEKDRNREIGDVFRPISEHAAALMKESRYVSALDALEAFPARYRQGPWQNSYATQRTEVIEASREWADRTLQAAAWLAACGRRGEAQELARLVDDETPAWDRADLNERLTDLRARLEELALNK
jgi:eukaryotic-like serine/threonine-protein kinase